MTNMCRVSSTSVVADIRGEGMQEKIKVLVVDDEYAITQNLEYALKKSEYAVFTALNGDDGLALFKQENPSVVILDIKMPGINGLKLLDIIKEDSPEVSVIMLTSMALNSDIERGLDNGADRYLVKDTTPAVVVSNVNAMLRSRGIKGNVIRHGIYSAVLEDNRLEVDSIPIECTLQEFKMMCALIKRPQQIFKRSQLITAVYGSEARSDRSIDQHVKRIRQKVKDAGLQVDPIRTVPTIGYKLGSA